MNAPLKAVPDTEKPAVKRDVELESMMRRMARDARQAARVLALAPPAQKNRALVAMAAAIRRSRQAILAGNAEDQAEARRAGATPAFLDRLALTAARIEE